MDITLETIPSYTLAYIRRIGPYGVENKKIMEQLKDWARNRGLLNKDAIVFGIAQDSPLTTNPELCRYDTCLVVGKTFVSDKDFIQIRSLSEGKYCVFKIEHTEQAVQEAWSNLFVELARRSYIMDEARPILERYSMQMVNDHFCEICVPIL
jgi:DNA gyrase inhibitor GyrI